MTHGPGQEFTESNSGDVRGDRPERAADFDGGVRLRVEGLVLRRAALEPQVDDVLCLPKSRTKVGGQIWTRSGTHNWWLARPEYVGQGDAGGAQGTDSQPFPPRNPVSRGYRFVSNAEHKPSSARVDVGIPTMSCRSRRHIQASEDG